MVELGVAPKRVRGRRDGRNIKCDNNILLLPFAGERERRETYN